MDPKLVLLAAGFPALIAGVLVLVARRVAPAGGNAARASLAAPVAIAAGAALGQFAVTGWSFAPSESWHWVPWVTLAMLVPAVLASSQRLPAPLWIAAAALACAVLFARLLGRRLEIVHGAAAVLPWCIGWGLLAAAAAFAMQRVARRIGSPTIEFLCAGAGLGTAGLAVCAGSVMLALAATAVAAACAGAGAAAALRRLGRDQGALAAVVAAPALMAIALASHHYADATYSPWLWALLGVGACAPALVGERAGRSAARRFALRVLCAAIPIGAALGLAYRTYSPPWNPYD